MVLLESRIDDARRMGEGKMRELHAAGPKRQCKKCQVVFVPRPPKRVYCDECAAPFKVGVQRAYDIRDDLELDAAVRWRYP